MTDSNKQSREPSPIPNRDSSQRPQYDSELERVLYSEPLTKSLPIILAHFGAKKPLPHEERKFKVLYEHITKKHPKIISIVTGNYALVDKLEAIIKHLVETEATPRFIEDIQVQDNDRIYQIDALDVLGWLFYEQSIEKLLALQETQHGISESQQTQLVSFLEKFDEKVTTGSSILLVIIALHWLQQSQDLESLSNIITQIIVAINWIIVIRMRSIKGNKDE